jgi:effector-binding domain-containing protein
MSGDERNRMDDLLPIGRFSRMSRLSVKALRFYDEQGLLSPAWVDPASGYRYYRRGQANRAEAIRILRQVDMPLEEIREVLTHDDPDMTTKRLTLHRQRLEERLADQERMLRFLETLMEREGGIMPYQVTTKQVANHRIASLKTHTDATNVGEAIGNGFATVFGSLVAEGVHPSGPPFLIMHDVIDEETAGTIEVCIPVPDGTTGGGAGVEWREVPAGTVATTTHQGAYDELAPAYHTVTGWIEDHGFRVVGPPREIYLNDPESVPRRELLTEVQFPVEPVSER